MALDPQLLEILACPEDKGPLLYFEDEDSLYNPRLKRRYADPRRHPDHADRRGRDGRRRRARAAAGQGRGRGHQAHVRGLTLTDGASAERARHPRHVRGDRAAPRAGRRGGRGRRRGSTACPTTTTIDNVVVLGMGGSGIAGDVLAAIAGPFVPVPIVVTKGYAPPSFVGPGHAVLRRVVLGRHRGDGRGGLGRGGGRRPHGGGDRGGRARRAGARAGRRRTCRCPTASRCRGPALGALAVPPLVRARAGRACSPGPRAGSTPPSRS